MLGSAYERRLLDADQGGVFEKCPFILGSVLLNTDALASLGLTVYLVLAPTWACWMGVRLLRAPSPGIGMDRSMAMSN